MFNMYQFKKNILFGAVLLVLVAALMAACSSRYRLDLYMAVEGERDKVDVEQTQYVVDARLGEFLAENKLLPGKGNVVIATTGTRRSSGEEGKMPILSFDEYLRCRLHLQLPEKPEPDSIDLVDNSFVQLLGRYDWSTEDKTFMPRSGYFLVDSVGSNRVFITIDGAFENHNGVSLGYSGKFKVKATF